jgi:hypothetical protein
MKILFDSSEVSARSYYYLLDWNELDQKNTINNLFGKIRLCDLTLEEYKKLFKIATEKELYDNFNWKE